jgi:hypothetical protein
MKILLIAVFSTLILSLLFQSFILMPKNKTEEQPYTVVLKDKAFEIRLYPEATMATIYADVHKYQDLSGPGFRKLAGYIFGGNESKQQIAMTAPVHMDINDKVSSMSFVMPAGYTEDNLPKPSDAKVVIHKSAAEYAAAIRFGGYASDQDIKAYSQKLSDLLKEKGITTIGNFRFLGYDPPYKFLGRRNEIIVSINWK